MARQRRKPPVIDFEDAVTFLSYMARFIDGDAARNCDGCLAVLIELEETLAETQARCVELARRLEAIEAKGEGL